MKIGHGVVGCEWFHRSLNAFSSIHLRGRFTTFTSTLSMGAPASPSENRVRSGRTGHGRMFDAETVRHAATNVNPKRVETNERRWVRRRTLWMDILYSEFMSTCAHSGGGIRAHT